VLFLEGITKNKRHGDYEPLEMCCDLPVTYPKHAGHDLGVLLQTSRQQR
jgi:hypothetical protein